MAHPILTSLDSVVTRTTTVQASASVLLRGINARLAAAVAAALANGATAAELQPVQALADALGTSTDDLSAAVAENTAAATEPDIPPVEPPPVEPPVDTPVESRRR